MKKLFFWMGLTLATTASIFFTSCKDLDESDVNMPDVSEYQSTLDFNYATSVTPIVSVSYQNLGYGQGVTTSVYFELYTENPLTADEEGLSYTLRDDVTPIFTGYTKKDGTWEGTVDIPSYATTLYSYAPGAPLTKLIETTVSNGTIIISDEVEDTSSSATTRSASPMRVSSATSESSVEYLGTYRFYTSVSYNFSILNYSQNLYLCDEDDELSVSSSTYNTYSIFSYDGYYFLYSTAEGKFVDSDLEFSSTPEVGFNYKYYNYYASTLFLYFCDYWYYSKYNISYLTATYTRKNNKQITYNLETSSQYASIWNYDTMADLSDSQKSSAIAAIESLFGISESTTTDEEEDDDDTDGAYGDGLHFCKAVNHTGITGNTISDPWGSYSDANYPKEWKTWLGKYSNTCNTYLEGKSSQGTGSYSTYDTGGTVELPGINWLNYMAAFTGSYTELCGGINYADKFATTVDENILKIDDVASLLEVHEKVISVTTAKCDPTYWGANQTITLTEDASIAIAFVASKSGTAAALGYYYYEDTPTSVSELNPILIFPNVQDGAWNVTGQQAGVRRGTNVQLYYYGPSDNMDKANKTNVFPAGTKIGFIFMGRAWTDEYQDRYCDHNRWGFDTNTAHYSTTTKGIYNGIYNVSSDGTQFSGSAMYAPSDEEIIFSFEDSNNDYNCSDCIFALRTNPLNAYSGVTRVSGVMETKTLNSDVYAFEDMWPDEGDYDMNDVIVQVDQSKMSQTFTSITTTNGWVSTTSSSTYLMGETFRLTTFENFAAYANGLAAEVTFGNGISWSNLTQDSIYLLVDSTTVIEPEDITPTSTGFRILFTNNIHAKTDNQPYEFVCMLNNNGTLYKSGHTLDLVIKYTSPENDTNNAICLSDNSSITQSSISPFIYRWDTNQTQKTWEVHIPYEAPSAINIDYRESWNNVTASDFTYLMHNDDGSDPANGKFYLRAETDTKYRPYPFAFKLTSAKVLKSNLYKLLLPDNEEVPIDEIFPNFINWVNDQTSSSPTGEYDGWYNE